MDELNYLSRTNPELINLLFEEGAFFIFLDVPPGSEFGVDMKIWNTAEYFKGVKMIPPGMHYIHYSCVDKYGENRPRSGFFHNFKQREILVRKWDKKLDDISPLTPSEDEIKRFRDNIKNMDKYLGSYPYDIYQKWINLSNHLHDKLVSRLSPSCGIIRAATDLVACNDADRPRGTQEEVGESSKQTSRSPYKRDCDPNISGGKDHLLPELKPVEGTELRFTKFPERHYPSNASPSEITFHSLDYTYMLECILDCHMKPLDFLGEIQFAYICFLVGGNLDAFEHWKQLIGLLCNCQKAITKYRVIYDHLPDMLEIQINEIPADFLVDIVSSNNFIYVKIKNLFRLVNESSVDGRIKSKMSRFQQSISEKFDWDLDYENEESDDEKPVIVDINEEMYSSNNEINEVTS